jgi:hypothetical protein
MERHFDKLAYFNAKRCIRNKYITGVTGFEHGATDCIKQNVVPKDSQRKYNF